MLKKYLVRIVISCLVIIGIVNVWMYQQQPFMVFYPYETLVESPKDWSMDYEDVSVNTSDGLQLHGWYIPKPGASKTILFFHGNGGNISHRGESIKIFRDLGLNVFIIDYRGYGNSQGSPSEEGFYEDSRTAWKYLTEQKSIKPEDIIIFGRSLGGAVAVRLASDVSSSALIIESTFTSANDMAGELMPFVSNFIVFRYQFNSIGRIKSIKQPLLVIHSFEDEIIPFKFGKRLFNEAEQPKVFAEISGDHNNGFLKSKDVYENALRSFIGKYQEDGK